MDDKDNEPQDAHIKELNILLNKQNITDDDISEAEKIMIDLYRKARTQARSRTIKPTFTKQKLDTLQMKIDDKKKELLLKQSPTKFEQKKNMTDTDIKTIQKQQLSILQSSLKQLNQCEDLSRNTMTNLQKQGEKIKESREKAEKINEKMSTSNKLLNKLQQWWRG